MQPISPQALRLAQDKAPQFVQAVQQAHSKMVALHKKARLTIRLDTFADDPFLLYACLWYAATEGVAILFRAEPRTRS